MKVISWNISQREEAWRWLVDSDADLAMLQEAGQPPPDVAAHLEVDPAPWHTTGAEHRPWRTAVVKLSGRVSISWIESNSISESQTGDLIVSRPGTLTAAVVTPPNGEALIVASMYAVWQRPHPLTNSAWIFADGSIHRVISDLSGLIGQQKGHRILAAGDFNILHGYGDHGSRYWASRYSTVFSRMTSLGLSFVGPQAPGGRQAEPWPDELPIGSKNVPTYHTRHQTPETATRQLDFVFASQDLSDQVKVRALNDPEEWGPSDHCRLEIEVALTGH